MIVDRTHTPVFLLGMLLCPLIAGAAPSVEPHPESSTGCDGRFNGPPLRPPGPPMEAGPGAFGGDDADRPPPFLRDLKLTDDQQDKVFAILHAAAPALRDQSKALRKARDALRELAKNARYDDTNAVSLAQAQGKAEGQMALLRTRMEHDLFSILTPEQTAQVTSHQQNWEPQRGEGPPPH